MPFDMGFNFRASSGFVTDPAYAVPVLSEAYPHTYTNGNGLSINAGWAIAPDNGGDRTTGLDVRLAGEQYRGNSNGAARFTVDLSSGSAPGAGSYVVDLAAGLTWNPSHQYVQVKDNTTALITIPGTATAQNHFIDATGADVTAAGTWTGTPSAPLTVATTTVNLTLAEGGSGSDWTGIAHFRLTLQGGGGSVPGGAAMHLRRLMGG